MEPTQTKHSELRQDPDHLDAVLRDGDIAANSDASKALDSAKIAMDFTSSTRRSLFCVLMSSFDFLFMFF